MNRIANPFFSGLYEKELPATVMGESVCYWPCNVENCLSADPAIFNTAAVLSIGLTVLTVVLTLMQLVS